MMITAYPTGERKRLHAQLRGLTGRWLLTEEAKKLEALAETLEVPLQWRRHDFAGNKCVALATQQEEPCY